MNGDRGLQIWKSVRLSVLVICVVVSHLLQPGTCTAEMRPDRSSKVMILPFAFDGTPNASLIAGQSAFILRRSLRAGRFILPEIMEHIHDEIPVTWENRLGMEDFFALHSVDWLVSGHVQNICRDPDAGIVGNRFIGMAGIPVAADITVALFHCAQKVDVWRKTLRPTMHVSRLRILGMNRNPYPVTVKTADAFVHDTMVRLARMLTEAIRSHEAGEPVE